jgi:predicted amidohydrolase
MNLIALQFKTTENFAANLKKLESLIDQSSKDSLILAPELCISGFYYDKFEEALKANSIAKELLLEKSKERTIATTLLRKKGDHHYNTLYIFHEGKVVHTQAKSILFVLNDERVHFAPGNEKDIHIIHINGIKVAALVCFELRFTRLWEQIKGADIVLVPAMWGKLRKTHFEALTKALAIMNQCYVVASDSGNKDMARGSGIISPFGNEYRDDSKELISNEFDPKLIKKMRRYLPVGISAD